MSVAAGWDLPSGPVAELIAAAAADLAAHPAALFAEMDETVLGAVPALGADATLAAETSASNRANILRWLTLNVQRPGARVPLDLTPEALDVARDIVRRGIDRTALLDGYRQGQNAAWRHWMEVLSEHADDTRDLGAALDVTARSMFAFVDDVLVQLQAQVERERDELLAEAVAQRLETVNLVLQGAPIPPGRASARLGYDLGRRHLAAVLWTEGPEPEQGALERAADLLARAAGARRAFTVPAGATAVWAWAAVDGEIVLDGLREAMAAAPDGVLAAVGGPAEGIAGFRRSHLDAATTRRLVHRAGAPGRLTTYEEVEVVALAAQDDELAEGFVAAALGGLASAPEELRETLRIYLHEDRSATRTAQRTFTHRNTVLNRVRRAEALLPAPLAGRALRVGLALELRRWLGPR